MLLCSEPLHHRHTKRQPLGSAPGRLGKARQVSEARGPLVKDEQQALSVEQAFSECWRRRRESTSGNHESKEKTSSLLQKLPLPSWGDALDDFFFLFGKISASRHWTIAFFLPPLSLSFVQLFFFSSTFFFCFFIYT